MGFDYKIMLWIFCYLYKLYNNFFRKFCVYELWFFLWVIKSLFIEEKVLTDYLKAIYKYILT